MPQVRPFRFTNLRRYTSEQVALQESLAAYFSTRPFGPEFMSQLAGMLETYLKVPCRFSAAELQPIARANLAALLPSTTCLLTVGVAPGDHKILIDLDPGIAALAIDRLLGGSGENGRIQRPLTEIEQGVLSFILLKVLAFTHEGWETGRELALTLDRFASNLPEVQDIVDAEANYYMVGFSLAAGKRVGYVRVLLPAALVTKRFMSHVPQAGATPEELGHMRAMFKSLGERLVDCRVRGATLDLGPDDIAGLEPGDIVIMENHELALTDEGLAGNAFATLGRGKNGGLRCRVLADGGQQRLELLEIVMQEEPLVGDLNPENNMSHDAHSQAGGDEDNLPETEGLLRDVPAPVVVELGRIRMNTSQVIRLRQGQILRLPRGPNDPVDLVVNGKLFARGELIEVDGELGVRLLQVIGDG